MISGEGIMVDPKKTEAVKNWPRPLTSSDIRSFLGLAGYTGDLLKVSHLFHVL